MHSVKRYFTKIRDENTRITTIIQTIETFLKSSKSEYEKFPLDNK